MTNSSEQHTHAVFAVQEAPNPRTLVDILDATVNEHGDVLALEGIDGSLTYRELQFRVLAKAKELHAMGLGHGDRIGVRVPSGTTDLYVAILSVIYAGAAYVPMEWDEENSRVLTVWEEADVSAVFGEGLALNVMKKRNHVSVSPPTLEDDAWVIFTSGSTGKPKGVAISHRAAAALVDAEHQTYLIHSPLGSEDRVMAGLSVAFDASCEEMWLAWRNGATLVAAPRELVRSGEDLGTWIVKKALLRYQQFRH